MSISALIDKKELRLAQQLINNYNIPSPPKLLMDIKTELSQNEPNMGKIIDWISSDIGLTAEVIKIINSPLYGLSVEVTSLDQAINLLGAKKINEMILKPAYRQALEQSIEGFSLISETAHQTGSLAEVIQHVIETEQKCSFFYLAGLFHNVGALIMGAKYHDYMDYHEQNTLNPISWPVLEQERYGVRHLAIGVLLAKHWGLSNTVCNAIYLHHAVVPTYRKMIDTDSTTMGSVLILAIHMVNKYFLQLPVEKSVESDILFQSSIDELLLSSDALLSIEEDARLIY